MTTTQDAIKLAIEALERNKRGLENIELFGKSNVKFSGLTEMIEKTGAALAALQAREGEAVAPSAILARGRFHFFEGEDGEPDDWEWFEEGTNCEHGCIDAVIVRADAIAAPQPAQPTLKWCEQCGEGVTDFCRGKGAKCEYGFKPAGQPSEPAHPEQGPST